MLNDLQCRTAKARDKNYKLTDSRGLYLFVTAKGYRSWRWKYRFCGKERLLVLGNYPELGIKRAREIRDAAAVTLRSGIDPAMNKPRIVAVDNHLLHAVAKSVNDSGNVSWTLTEIGAAALADFTSNRTLAANGNQPVPGGYTMQWGSIPLSANSYATVTFSLAFANACTYAAVEGMGEVGDGGSANNNPREYAWAKTAISIYNPQQALSARWFAIGYS
ncbi:MAG: Arm DNA-binding domain-containing protein [Sphingobium sp.]